MKIEEIKFRASAIHQLMVNGRAKDEVFGLTAKSYIREVFISKKYGRTKAVTSKHMTKGIINEEPALTLFSDVTGRPWFKNEHNYSGEHFTGTPDIVDGDLVVDIKNSWDIFTFFEADVKTQYYWQLQCYMALTGADRAQLAYVLTNAPEWQILDEQKRLYWSMGGDNMPEWLKPEYAQKCEQIKVNMTFDDIPTAERVRIFDVERNEDDIERMRERVELAWKMMRTFEKVFV